MWGVIDTRKKTKQGFNSQGEAMEFYNKNCVNKEKTNCWGIFLDRSEEFWNEN